MDTGDDPYSRLLAMLASPREEGEGWDIFVLGSSQGKGKYTLNSLFYTHGKTEIKVKFQNYFTSCFVFFLGGLTVKLTIM